MFEHLRQPPIPLSGFFQRIIRNFGLLLVLVAVSLFVGAVGYRETEGMSWIDAFYNASLIMSGMGPATELQTDSGKIFASVYSLYSGLFLVAAAGLLLVPVFHRMLHMMHHEQAEKE